MPFSIAVFDQAANSVKTACLPRRLDLLDQGNPGSVVLANLLVCQKCGGLDAVRANIRNVEGEA
jgi:hypothetical protein